MTLQLLPVQQDEPEKEKNQQKTRRRNLIDSA